MLSRLTLNASEVMRHVGHGLLRPTTTPRDNEVDHVFDGQGCVVCNAMEKAEATYFFWFLAENKSDPAVMQDFAERQGFCRRHSRLLADNDQGLSLVELYELACSHALSRLASMGTYASKRQGESSDAAVAPYIETCPACMALSETEQHLFHVLCRALRRADLRENYPARKPLCFAHTQRFLALAPLESVPRIVGTADCLLAACTEASGSITDTDMARTGALLFGRSALVAAAEPHGGMPPTTHPDPANALCEVVRARRGCPVCHEVLRVWLERLAWLSEWKAHATEREIEDLLPLCAKHFWGSLDALPDTLRAMTLTHALRSAREQLMLAQRPHAVQSRLGPMRWLRFLPPAARLERLSVAREIAATPLYCPMCKHAETTESRTVGLVLALAGHPMFRRTYDEGSGLCARHLTMAMTRTDAADAARYLILAQKEKLSLLRWELQEAARKDIWSARCEHRGTERQAWARATMLFAGTLSYDLDMPASQSRPSPLHDVSPGGCQ